jgi:hypothetical protein
MDRDCLLAAARHVGHFRMWSEQEKANRFASKFGLRVMVANGGASLEAWV